MYTFLPLLSNAFTDNLIKSVLLIALVVIVLIILVVLAVLFILKRYYKK